ncbi:MAG: HD domain-containing phosphohydrolase [Desulfobaccales bacterium]
MPRIGERQLTEYVSALKPEGIFPRSRETGDTFVACANLAKKAAFILIVDDDDSIRRILKEYLEMNGLSCKEASSAIEALEILGRENIDLIVSDIKMGGQDGVELMQEVRKDDPHIPFIMMTGYAPAYSYEDIIKAGASDFIGKPFSMGELKAKIFRIKREKDILHQLQHTLIMVKKLFANTVETLASTLEKIDPYTAGHQQRVGDLACAIAQEMGFARDRIEGLRLAASVHDIGKISVPTEILVKPGKMTEVEMGLIRVHSQNGYDILKSVAFPWPIAEMVLQHHERLNGSGYPQGLFGQEILMEARIIGVADVVEAMSAHRPYRPALELGAALEEIEQNRDILYDEIVVDSCLKLFREKLFEFETKKD